MEAATKRAIEFAPYADLLWVETGDPSVEKAADFAGKIRGVHPGKKLVYNLSPSFNWMGHGFTEESLKSFIWDLAKHGSVQSLIFRKSKVAPLSFPRSERMMYAVMRCEKSDRSGLLVVNT